MEQAQPTSVDEAKVEVTSSDPIKADANVASSDEKTEEADSLQQNTAGPVETNSGEETSPPILSEKEQPTENHAEAKHDSIESSTKDILPQSTEAKDKEKVSECNSNGTVLSPDTTASSQLPVQTSTQEQSSTSDLNKTPVEVEERTSEALLESSDAKVEHTSVNTIDSTASSPEKDVSTSSEADPSTLANTDPRDEAIENVWTGFCPFSKIPPLPKKVVRIFVSSTFTGEIFIVSQ